MTGRGAWPGHREPRWAGGVTKKAARARSRCPRPLREGAGTALAGCARSFSCDCSWLRPPNSFHPEHLRRHSPVLALDPPAPQNLPARGPRTPGLRRTEPGQNRSSRGAFRSPRPSSKSGPAAGTGEESLHHEIQKLKEKKKMLEREISQLISGRDPRCHQQRVVSRIWSGRE
ncbi:hypothetical protein GHT09_001444 [Marmota monax]|uniref:Uncharacterized protein n=1 Tax=Marmota monax TaxID=9995 RepID=A0A834QZ00_MARMO|nr:hypothetical protein GHT09_001444 [Marmota monax]